jgi:mannose-6-phosphate isomerase-like protein (cupin superfamily)
MDHTTILFQKINNTRSLWLDLGTSSIYDKPNIDKWSRIEILGHLIDSARYNLMRFTEAMITRDDIYIIKSYHQDQLVSIQNYQSQNAHTLLDHWIVLNQNIGLLWRSYDTNTWQRHISIKGETKNLLFLADDYLDHLGHHLGQIFDNAVHNDTPHGITLINAVNLFNQLPHEDTFITLINHGNLSVEYYKPHQVDLQKPHTRDEIYIIISGEGRLMIGHQSYDCKVHDLFFVKAGDEHRFLDFTEDFGVWVVFYGIDDLN